MKLKIIWSNEKMSIPQALPRVAAFEKLGFGLFVHWGLYSQLGQGEWSRHVYEYDIDEYGKLQQTFTACDFDADALCRMAKDAGMKYVVLTTRHHDGFSLYDTCGLNTFDAPHAPAGRDLVAEYVAACRKYDLVPFFYHTTMDWYWGRKKTYDLTPEEFREYLVYLRKSVELLCRNYGKIGGLWFDGNWSRPDLDWEETELYGMIRQYQPDAIIVNNTGIFQCGKTGHPEIDSVTYEQGAAKPMDREGMEKYIAGEVCHTFNNHWGIGAVDFSFKSPAKIIETLCHSRGCGANYLLNVGPEAQGRIPDYEKASLEIVGRWIKIFGEAIYTPRPIDGVNCQGRDFVLKDGKNAYYFVFDLTSAGNKDVTVNLSGPGSRAIDGFNDKVVSACWMDNNETIEFTQNTDSGMLTVKCTGYPYGTQTCVRVMKLVLA